MSKIQTYTGKSIDPLNPDPALIDIRDIAHALSFLCRGNGHVEEFFSVGQHCILCCREALARGLGRRTALACLLHDASEAYMADVPRPVKDVLPGYQEKEEALLQVIYEKFLGAPLSAAEQRAVKQIDDDLLYYDLRDLLHIPQKQQPPLCLAPRPKAPVPFAQVQEEYLTLWKKLTNDTARTDAAAAGGADTAETDFSAPEAPSEASRANYEE